MMYAKDLNREIYDPKLKGKYNPEHTEPVRSSGN